MRCYGLGDEGVLVEWATGDCDLPKPDGTVLTECATFYRLAPAGFVDGEWEWHQGSDCELLYTFAYTVEDGALVKYMLMQSPGRTQTDRQVVFAGLSPLTGIGAPSRDQVAAALTACELDRRERTDQRRQAQRLERFAASLPPLDAGRTIRLVWRYDGPDADVVISQSTGETAWREPFPGQGNWLHGMLTRVARERYGTALTGFDVDITTDQRVHWGHPV